MSRRSCREIHFLDWKYCYNLLDPCIFFKRLKSLSPQFMFEASDDEIENAVDPLPGNSLPAGFTFLGKLCECKNRACYRQFKSRADTVKQKQLEFRALQPHEKARCHYKTF